MHTIQGLEIVESCSGSHGSDLLLLIQREEVVVEVESCSGCEGGVVERRADYESGIRTGYATTIIGIAKRCSRKKREGSGSLHIGGGLEGSFIKDEATGRGS